MSALVAILQLLIGLPDILAEFALPSEKKITRSYLEGVRKRIAQQGTGGVVAALIRWFTRSVTALRLTNWLQFRRVFGAATAAQVLIYLAIWTLGTVGGAPSAQRNLPWVAYSQAVDIGKRMATPAESPPQSAIENSTKKQLRSLAENSSTPHRVVFTILYSLFLSALIATNVRIALWFAEKLSAEAHDARGFTLFAAIIFSWVSRVLLVTLSLGIVAFAQNPPLWVATAPLLSMGVQDPGLLGLFTVIASLAAALWSLASWMMVHPVAIACFHLATLPLRLTTYFLAACLILKACSPTKFLLRITHAIERRI